MGQGGAAGEQGAGGFSAFIPLILMFVIFYFLLIRPQQKKQKQENFNVDVKSRGIKMASDELIGIVIDIEKEELQKTKKKKPLAARIALSPLTFIAAQGRALKDGPYNPKLPEIEFVQRWIIRFEVPNEKSGEAIWTIQMSGSEFEGNVRVGDRIRVKGEFKRGRVIHCKSFTNVSAGSEVIAY
jgi:preprotein translocase YajC subunit